jgi:arginine N-succinyltransferase
MIRYEIRAATHRDHADLLELSKFLDSVNLPHDSTAITELLDVSERSFSANIGDPRRREYVFVLRDLTEQRAVGTSMIIGQLGRRDAPYIYVDVMSEEKYSVTLDKYFIHKVLSIGYSFNGPTEIGGLVMHPACRRAPERLGMLISYVRFLWIKMHREEMQSELLAELLPPLESDGTSHLWEAVGRHFTGLSYHEADRLSKKNKEFIRGLWPEGDIYASLLSPQAQEIIGKVGPQTKGVEKLLRRIGFRFADRVDPFDGGPHFVAPTDEVTLVGRARSVPISIGEVSTAKRALVAREHDGPPYFVAVASSIAEPRAPGVDPTVTIPPETAAHLGLTSDDEAWVLPLD